MRHDNPFDFDEWQVLKEVEYQRQLLGRSNNLSFSQKISHSLDSQMIIKRLCEKGILKSNVAGVMNVPTSPQIEPMYLDFMDIINEEEFEKRFRQLNKKYAQPEQRIKIIYDRQKGLYQAADPKSIYEISGKRQTIFEILLTTRGKRLRDLAEKTEQAEKIVSASLSEINAHFARLVAKKTGAQIVVGSRSGGFRINTEEYDVATDR